MKKIHHGDLYGFKGILCLIAVLVLYVSSSTQPAAALEGMPYTIAPFQYEYQFIRWALLSQDGKTVWTRTCRVNDSSIGYNYDSNYCSSWTSISLTNLRGVGNEAYAGYSAYVYHKNGQNILSQSLISMDGKAGWSRECVVDVNVGIAPTNCSAWSSQLDLTNLRGVGNEAYADLSAYVFINSSGSQVLRQTLLSKSLDTSWERTCPISNTSGILWSSCSSWSGDISLSNLIPILGSTQKYRGFADHYYYIPGSNGGFFVRQAVVGISGTASWGRTCPLSSSGTLQLDNCRDPYGEITSGDWGRVTLANVIPGISPIGGIDEIVYTLNTSNVNHP